MKRVIAILITFILLLIGFYGKGQNGKPKCNCSLLSPTIEVWNHSGSSDIIDNWGNRNDTYAKSNGWNSTDFPYPKMFDLKLSIINNPILYDNSSVKIGKYRVSVNLKLKIGQGADASYPLNSNILENISLVKDRIVTDADFNAGQTKDYIEIWTKNIAFSALYEKYHKKGLFINQFIFEIQFVETKTNCTCIYEYVFPMLEKAEP